MKLKFSKIFSNFHYCIVCSAFILLTPQAFSNPLLSLGAPRETLTAKTQGLLKLPQPRQDLSVYTEQAEHYHLRAATQTLVISPVPQATLPNPTVTKKKKPKAQKVETANSAPEQLAPSDDPAPQMAIPVPSAQMAAKASKAVPAEPVAEPLSSLDNQEDAANNSHFSLQHAAGLGPDSRIQFNGFFGAGFLATDDAAEYVLPGYGRVHNAANFAAPSDIGLQVTGNILHNVSVIGQLVADGDNSIRDNAFTLSADWAYLRYMARPDLQLRAGRFRLPTLFYSENAKVGYTYPWINLPNEVYGPLPVVELNGISTVSSLSLGQGNWTLRAQPFFGSGSTKTVIFGSYNPAWISGTAFNLSQDDVYGTAVSLGNHYFEIRGSYMGWETRATAPLVGTLCPDGTRQTRCTYINGVSSDFYSAGAKLDFAHFLLVGEYAHRELAAFFANLNSYYVMAAYQFRGFMPNLTYARAKTSNNRILAITEGQLPIAQDSLTLGLDYTINSNLLAKISLSGIRPLDGTYGFFTINPGRKTVMMYGVSLDAIF